LAGAGALVEAGAVAVVVAGLEIPEQRNET